MISISLLSLSPDMLQRMAANEAHMQTGGRRWERMLALGFILLICVGAAVALLSS